MKGLAVFLILLMSWRCLAADFQVTAPPQWKLIDSDGDGLRLYKNSQSKANESVTIHSFQMEYPERGAHLVLHERAKELTELRRRFMINFGIQDFAVIAMERRKSTNPGFGYMQVIQSSFIDIEGRDVQALERQFLRNGKLFVITYLIDSPALNNRERAEQVLDLFQPQTNSHGRDPAAAAEVLSRIGSSAARAGVSTYGSDAFSSRDLDMRDPRNQTLCKDVPAERKRSESDQTFMGVLDNTVKAPANCFLGTVDNFVNFVKGTVSLMTSAGKYLNPFNSIYRDQVNASVGAVVAAFAKDKSGFMKKAGGALYDFIAKQVGETFYCLKPSEQVRAICDFATNFVPLGSMAKLVTKSAPMAGEELAKLARGAREAVGDLKVQKGESRALDMSPDQRIREAQKVIGRELTAPEKVAVLEAHEVGTGEKGADRIREAGVDNYTKAQLRRKSEVLAEAGFTKDQRRKLVEAKIVGKGFSVPEKPPLFENHEPRIQRHLTKADEAALSRLKAAANKRQNFAIEEAKDGGVRLKIGHLRTDSDFMRAIHAAIQRGLVTEVDAGAVAGPKVLPLILSISRAAPTGSSLKIRGWLIPAFLNQGISEGRAEWLKRGAAFSKSKPKGPLPPKPIEEMTEAEKRVFRYAESKYQRKIQAYRRKRGEMIDDQEAEKISEAIQTLKIQEACLKYHNKPSIAACYDLLSFEFNTNSPTEIHWSPRMPE